jgi:casein kinase 1
MPFMCFGWCSFVAPGFQFDYVFDWTILKYQQSQIATPPARAIVSGGVLSGGMNCYVI